MIKQRSRVPRVLGGNHIDGLQHFNDRSVISPMFPMGVGTTYNAAFNSRSSTYNQWKLGGSFVMTSKYSTSAAHNRTLLALLHRSVLMALALMLIASCATPPPAPPKPREPVTDYPMPSRDKVEKTEMRLTRLMPALFLGTSR